MHLWLFYTEAMGVGRIRCIIQRQGGSAILGHEAVHCVTTETRELERRRRKPKMGGV